MNEATKIIFQYVYQQVFFEPLPDPELPLYIRVGKFDYYCEIASQLLSLIQSTKNIANFEIIDLLCKPDFQEFQDIRNIRSLKEKTIEKFSIYHSSLIRFISILYRFASMFNINSAGIAKQEKQTSHIARKFLDDNNLHDIKLEEVVIIELDQLINRLIEDLSNSPSYRTNQLLIEIEKLKYVKQVCSLCKIHPAMFYVYPCLHVSLCDKCMKDMNEQDAVVQKCYFCHEKVERLEYLRFYAPHV